MNAITPMMQQYLEIKAKYPEALLLYRMGDFYEMFMDDAVTASRVLEIALTSRDRQAENPIPMCGVPYHAAESYIAKLISAGFKVAVCDQVEDPKKAKGLVKREVTRVMTPGLILDNQNLTSNQSNYLAAVASSGHGGKFGLAYLDISTAEFRVTELDSEETLIEELLHINPSELLLPEGEQPEWIKPFSIRCNSVVTHIDAVHFDRRRAFEMLTSHFRVHSLEGFGIASIAQTVPAAGAVLAYSRENLFGSCDHVRKVVPYSRSEYMLLDDATVRNLEIFQSANFQGRKGSLLGSLDQTRTAMGGRRLQQWLRYPLLDLSALEERQEAVAELVAQSEIRSEILSALESVNDIERLNGRNSTGISTPRDLIGLKRSFQFLPRLGELLSRCESALLAGLAREWDTLGDLTATLEASLTDPPPATLSSGGAINHGFNSELDHYIRLSRDAKGWMAEYEARQRKETGISSLKVRFNKVFGYYIEVSRANLSSIPDSYFRKQTLVNAERFITEELKDFEVQVLEADEKRLELEQQIFLQMRELVAANSTRIQEMANKTAILDCIVSFAEVAARFDYCRPLLDSGDAIHIQDGRHPVVERFLEDGNFVPNDLHMDQEGQEILIITGPNMAGKSTILRQAALIVLLAQIGCFVPAAAARIGLVDRIFTRVGASDDLARGRSTFMVEMQETANILHQATSRSLVILDEIGRGTSTFDGMSIAWAVAEFLHDFEGKGIKTLFATHYHELTELAKNRPRVRNFNVAIREWQQEILFFHKLTPGSSNRSYGIQVARLAGLPEQITDRANEILLQLEGGQTNALPGPGPKAKQYRSARDPEPGVQLSMFQATSDGIKERIAAAPIDQMTPVEALQMLNALQEEILRGEIRSRGQVKRAASGRRK